MDYKALMTNGTNTDKELPVIVFLHGANGDKIHCKTKLLTSKDLRQMALQQRWQVGYDSMVI